MSKIFHNFAHSFILREFSAVILQPKIVTHMETKKNQKSSRPYLFKSYIWLINTIARGPISRAAIDEKWAHASANVYKHDSIPESMSANNLLKDSEELSDRILFEPVPSGEKFLTPIIEAMRDMTAINMKYQGFTRQKPATFSVEPYCLKVFKQRWYMLAYSPGLDKTMIYSLDRVHAIEPTKQKYKLPKGFNAEEYFKNTYGVTGMDEEPEVIEICIDAMQANYLRTLPLHSSQEEIERNDDYSIFRFHMVPSYEFLQELRKYGSDVEVISPESVRAEFREDTESLYRIYKQMESWV